jgi:hypothetical protein
MEILIMGMSEDPPRVYATVSEDLKREIRVEAAKRDMSMSQLLGKILEEEFGAEGNPNPAMARN